MSNPSASGKERSRKGKESRAQQKNLHTGGSWSIARHAYALEKQTGRAVDRATLYISLLMHGDDTPINAEAEENIRQMEELLNQQPSEQTTLSSEGHSSGTINWLPTDVYAQVMGPERHDRVRGLGFRPTPSRSSQSGRNIPRVETQNSAPDNDRMAEMETQIRSLQNLVQELVQEIRVMMLRMMGMLRIKKGLDEIHASLLDDDDVLVS
ncbi:hypothetical protein CJ030_MR1G022527 [Morella rubra]|uniref:Uncharacterized protein n=1 Tax=Morella rubra TaxID=262757 RepID=A0A6A1WNL8_9ROSI|nr:hypothetical protein CJ030_MR1G022527 [Morella rubra]